MKSVLPRLAEFGEDEGEGPASGQRGQGHGGYKRPGNRPTAANKLAHGHWPGMEAQAEVVSPSSINLTCTGVRDPTTAAPEAEGGADGVSPESMALARQNLRLLQSTWEGPRQLATPQLSTFTLVGQGAAATRDQPRVLAVDDIPTDVPVDGRTEWRAVPWRLPRHHSSSTQLACLLFCKGVSKAQLPRVDIANWKPASVGVPTFHCKRCLRHWFKSGGLLPECDEPEDITEGPAMCITFSTHASSEMIVSGIVGEDGKPIRVKVEKPEAIKTYLAKKGNRRSFGTRRKGNKKGRRPQRSGSSDGRDSVEMESFEDETDSNSEVEDGSVLDLPEDIKRYILKQERKRTRERRGRRRKESLDDDTGAGLGSPTPDSTSDCSSNYDIEDESLLAHGKTKQNGWDQRDCLSSVEDGNLLKRERRDGREKKGREERRERSWKRGRKDRKKRGKQNGWDQHDCSSSSEDRNIFRRERGERGWRGERRERKEGKEGRGRERSKRQKHRRERYDESCSSNSDSDEWSSDHRYSSQSCNGCTRTRDIHLPLLANSAEGMQYRRLTTEDQPLLGGLDPSEHLPDIVGTIRDRIHSRGHGERSQMADNQCHFKLPHISESAQDEVVNEESSPLYGGSRECQIPGLSAPRPTRSVQEGENTSGCTHGPDPFASTTGPGQSLAETDSGWQRNDVRDSWQNPNNLARNRTDSLLASTKAQDSENTLPHSRKEPQKSRGIGSKAATILHDVHVPVKRTEGVLKKGARTQRPQKASKGSNQQIKPSTPTASTPNPNRRDSTQIMAPKVDDKMVTQGPAGLQQLPTEAQENSHPKRIGRKIVKKTRHPTEFQRMAVKHNSKDLGDVADFAQIDEQTRGDSESFRGNILPTLREELECETSVIAQDSEKSPRLLAGTCTDEGSHPTDRQLSTVTKSPALSRSSLTADGGRSGGDNNSTAELLSGLGPKESEMANREQPRAQPPVRLRPISQSADGTLGSDREMAHGKLQAGNDAQDGVTRSAEWYPPPLADGPANSPEPTAEILTEEEEEDSDSTEESIFPVFELRELTGLCFTSPFTYSFFPMAVQYQEVYDTVRSRSLQPVSVARLKPRKLNKGRK